MPHRHAYLPPRSLWNGLGSALWPRIRSAGTGLPAIAPCTPARLRPSLSLAPTGRSLAILATLSLHSTLLPQAIAQPSPPPPATPPSASPPLSPNQTITCDVLIAGAGLAGSAAAYEALLAGRSVCLTDITDWVGGQLSAQGTSALDEAQKQRALAYYPRGYLEFRDRIRKRYGKLNPGDCWVSQSCFLPRDAHAELWSQLQAAQKTGRGKLHWFPHTVIQGLETSGDGQQITAAIALQSRPAPGTPHLNHEPLSQLLTDIYSPKNSPRLHKTTIRFQAPRRQSQPAPPWYVIDATETGELVAIADVPYRLGIDPRSYLNPSSASIQGDPYCTQGFTYTFAFEQTANPQPQPEPSFYPRYRPYYGFDPNPNLSSFDAVFTYRRIWAPQAETRPKTRIFKVAQPQPGDISMQNWVWGNDYRPGTAQDNLVYSRDQLRQTGQLNPGGWRGGLRPKTLQSGEELALGFYHWLVADTTNSQGKADLKYPHLNHRLLTGLDSPMGTSHGLSKYPYIREGRRIIGRPSYAHPTGFSIDELDISRQNFRDPYYQALPPRLYRSLWRALAGLEAIKAINGTLPLDQIQRRSRSTIYPDSVGIAQYAIDFHPCMAESPPEKAGNIERPGARQGHGQAYPAQIPLRAMIPQRLDNLVVAGKAIATSHIAAAAYRVHSFEWSVGAAAGTAVDLALTTNTPPYQMVDDFPRFEPILQHLRDRLAAQGNPTTFPDTSIFNQNWDAWKVW